MGEAVDARGMCLAHVALEAAGPRGQPDQPELPGDAVVDAPGVLEPRHHRGRVPQQLRRLLGVAVRARPASTTCLAGARRPRRTRRRRAAPARGRSGCRTERRVRFRKSPRSRPQYEAVGKNPTSSASAPRSPVWLASRSSSRAIPRSACARAGTRVRRAPPPPGSRRSRGRPSCRRPASPCSGSSACPGRRRAPAPRPGAGSRARSPDGRPARRGTGSGSARAR